MRVPRTTGSPLITVGSTTTSVLTAARFGAAIPASISLLHRHISLSCRQNATSCRQRFIVRSNLKSGRFSSRGLDLLQMLHRRRALVAQVGEQDVGELAAGATAQRFQDRLVLAHGLAPALALAGEIGGVADAADTSGEAGIGREQGGVARGLDDLLVDELVDAEIAVHVTVQVEAVH